MHTARRLITVVLLGSTTVSAAETTKEQCADAAHRGQFLRESKKLVDARAAFEICSSEDCPAPIRGPCQTWLKEVDDLLPKARVILDPEQSAVARITLDGRRLDHSTNQAFAVDPGEHTFVLERDGAAPVVQYVRFREGDSERTVSFGIVVATPLSATGEVKRKDAARPTPLGVWLLGGLGAVSLAGFSVLAIAGNHETARLEKTCGTKCPEAEFDGAWRYYQVADVALAVGLTSLAGAAIWWVLRPHESSR